MIHCIHTVSDNITFFTENKISYQMHEYIYKAITKIFVISSTEYGLEIVLYIFNRTTLDPEVLC